MNGRELPGDEVRLTLDQLENCASGRCARSPRWMNSLSLDTDADRSRP